MAEVKWTPQALDDLDAICLFIARDAPPVAAVFAQRAFDATDRLADFPESGRIVPEMNDPSFREIIFRNYRLIYRPIWRRSDFDYAPRGPSAKHERT